MKLLIYENSKNYTAQIVRLSQLQKVEGLDNLVRVNVQGNDCLIGKDTNVDELQIFFPAECQLSEEFLSANNLYRHAEKNFDPDAKGFFEDNGRVKAMKFKGVISTGFVTPISSLNYLHLNSTFKAGEEFNSIDGYEVCKKYYRKLPRGPQEKAAKLLDEIIDSKLAPEHPDTDQLLRNVSNFNLTDNIVITIKLHGTSARYYNTLVNRRLTWLEKLALKLGIKVQTQEYAYVCASRRVIKSVNFKTLDSKYHYYDHDLWSRVGNNFVADRLHQGEAVYCEIIGKDYAGAAIQHGYSYNLEVPIPFVYRISHITPQGVEIDLPFDQMCARAEILGLEVCPPIFQGTLEEFILGEVGEEHAFFSSEKGHRDIEEVLKTIFYDKLLEQPSVFDKKVVEEGFVIRRDSYPKPYAAKIKSKKFLLHEGHNLDKDIIDIEADEGTN